MTTPRLTITPQQEPPCWLDPPRLGDLPAPAQTRIAVTLACRDSDDIPKVRDAGRMFALDGEVVQVMHEGTLVRADGYCGRWMSRLIAGLHGHHEPQEERLFQAVVAHARPRTLMVELGAYWAYYTNWYLGAVPGSRGVCLEPEPANLEIGRRNLALNGRQARLIHAAAGEEWHAAEPAGDDGHEGVECLDMPALDDRLGGQAVEVLHMDMQGAELGFIRSMRRSRAARRVRFVVVSTHHESITGSATTHDDCLEELRGQGAEILAEHSVAESFSGDGLIVASFDGRDRWLRLPPISRAVPEVSQLIWEAAGSPPQPTAEPRWFERQAAKVRRSWTKRLAGLGVRERAA